MISVQIDVRLPDEDGDLEWSAVWSGVWAHLPPVGSTLEIRDEQRRVGAYYRVLGSHAILHADDDLASSVIVWAESIDPAAASPR